MDVIERVIQEKSNELLAFEAKKLKREELAFELSKLDSEIEAFDQDKILTDIAELKECSKQLEYLHNPQPIAEPNGSCSTLYRGD